MKKLLTLSLLSLVTFSFSQTNWTIVHQFSKPISFIEASDNSIAVVTTDSSYHIQKDDALGLWTKIKLQDRIIDIANEKDTFFLASSKRIYQHSESPVIIQELTGNINFKTINIQGNKKIVSLYSLYPNIINYFVELFENLIPIINVFPDRIASDDNKMIIGTYGSNNGVYIYDFTTNTQSKIHPLESENSAPVFVRDSTIIIGFAKAGTDIYVSHNYGQTYVTYPNTLDFAGFWNTNIEYSKGNIFVGGYGSDSKGIKKSINDGATWTIILSDSAITDLAIHGNELYASTDKGTLIKTSISPVTGLENLELEKVYFSNNYIYNASNKDVNFEIYNTNGILEVSGNISFEQNQEIKLKSGIYLLQYKYGETLKTEKIFIQ